LGIVLGVLLVLSVYVEFVHLSNGVVWHDFVEAVSLRRGSDLANCSQFAMGEDAVVLANVSGSNAYFLRVYDDAGGLVYEASGDVEGSEVRAHMSVSPSVFGAGKVYCVVFEAGLLNNPLPGVSVSDSSAAVFRVVKSSTRMVVGSNFNGVTKELQLRGFLGTSELVAVENKTVGFYWLPNMDLPMRDRGWVYMGAGETCGNGTFFYSIAVDVMGGRHAVEARFDGDADFASCYNSTSFVVVPRVPHVQIVSVDRTGSRVGLLLRVTDKYGFPLGGRLFGFEALNVSREAVYVVSNGSGYVFVSMDLGRFLTSVNSKITILGDDYTSRLQVVARLNLTGSKVSSEVISVEGVQESEGVASGVGATGYSVVSPRGLHTLSMLSENVMITFSPNPPEVDLHDRVNAKIVTTSEDYDVVTFKYKLRCGNETEFLGEVTASLKGIRESGHWVFIYNGTLLWTPQYYGNYSMNVEAWDSGMGLIANSSVSCGLQRGYANIVAYYPEAFVGGSLNLALAFSKARTYAVNESGYFQSARLAPKISWDGGTYVLDQPNSTLLHVYVNGSKVADVVPDYESGVCRVLLNYSFSGCYAALNIRVVSDEAGRFFETMVERNLSLTKVSVSDVVSAGSGQFRLNYSLGICDGGERTYVNLANSVEASAFLLDQAVYNVSTSVKAARIVSRSNTSVSGWVSVPAGCNYMRVQSACYLVDEMASPLADVYKDGNDKVDMKDINLIGNYSYTVFGDSEFDWALDQNWDGQINNTDVGIVVNSFNRHISYIDKYGNYDYTGVMVDFSNGQNVSLDSRGFAVVPSGASWLNMSIGGIVEFFNVTYEGSGFTDNVGCASVGWCANQTGVYVLQVMLPSKFNATVAFHSSVTEVNASLCVVKYFCVQKRPVNLAVDLASEFHIVTMEAEADAFVYQGDPYGNYEGAGLAVGAYNYLEYRSCVRFNLSSIPENAYVLSARANLYRYWYGGDYAFGNLQAYRVNSSWYASNITWSNMPSCESTYSSQVLAFREKGWLFFDVTEDVRMWRNGSANNGLIMKKRDAVLDLLFYIGSREVNRHLVLEVSYLLPSTSIVANAYDNVTGQAVSDLSVQFSVNDVQQGSVGTNSSGMAVFSAWRPTGNAVYNVSVSSQESVNHTACVGSNLFDFRYSTNISSLNENPRSVIANFNYTYGFAVNSSSLFGLKGLPIKFYANGTDVDDILYVDYLNNATVWDGGVSFAWAAPGNGTYSIKAVFEGSGSYKPCETYVCVNASVMPLAILFGVSPCEFELGASLLLNATIIDVSTGKKLNESCSITVRFVRVCGSGLLQFNNVATTTGEALLNTEYPNSPEYPYAYAYMAKILPEYQNGRQPQGIAGNPVQLTVSVATKLLLNVSRDFNGSKHMVECRLVRNSTGAGVSGRQVKIKVNDTETSYATDSNGSFNFTQDFLPRNDQTTVYMITVTFEGDQPLNATAWAKTLDGQSYAACTTVQYGYKPSCNSTVLTVEPQGTGAATQDKTPEEMQKEAEECGGLTIWHEFAWWYPWYRLHFVLSTTLPPYGVLFIDYGWSPLYGMTLQANTTVLALILNDVAQGFAQDYIIMTIVTMIGQRIAAGLFGRTVAGMLAAIAGYLTFSLVKMGLEYVANGYNLKTWLVAFVSTAIGCFLDLMTGIFDTLSFLTAVTRQIIGAVTHTLNSMWARSLDFFDITGIIFTFIDFALMVGYLILYKAG